MALPLFLSVPPALGVEGASRFSPDGLPLGVGCVLLFQQWGGLTTFAL